MNFFELYNSGHHRGDSLLKKYTRMALFEAFPKPVANIIYSYLPFREVMNLPLDTLSDWFFYNKNITHMNVHNTWRCIFEHKRCDLVAITKQNGFKTSVKATQFIALGGLVMLKTYEKHYKSYNFCNVNFDGNNCIDVNAIISVLKHDDVETFKYLNEHFGHVSTSDLFGGKNIETYFKNDDYWILIGENPICGVKNYMIDINAIKCMHYLISTTHNFVKSPSENHYHKTEFSIHFHDLYEPIIFKFIVENRKDLMKEAQINGQTEIFEFYKSLN